MMRKIIFISLFVCMAWAGLAQSNKDSSVYKRKNELVLDIKINNPPYDHYGTNGIMYRRNFKGSSLRVKFNGGYRYSNYSNFSSYIIAPSIGLQKNVKFSENFQFYWGADLKYNYRGTNSKDSTDNYLYQSNSIGISPLIGVRYYYKRLVLGVETSGGLNYRIDDYRGPAKRRVESFDFQFRNASKFFIGFTF